MKKYFLNCRFFLDSEQNKECIDSKIMCNFLFCMYEPYFVEIMLQFKTSGVVSSGKLNILVAL